MKNLEANVESILLSKEEIALKVKETAQRLNEHYKGQEVVMVCILKGSVSFFSDLAREINFPVMYDFMSVSSYGSGAVSSGNVVIKQDLSIDITGKHVLIVEDIIDSGNTMYALKDLLLKKSPASVKLCCLLDKPERRVAPVEVDFAAFNIPDAFVVGYGLDFNEEYRQLPYIGILKPSVYE